MTVKIVTDSTSDLTPEIAGELGITVVPLYVHFGTEAYRDGIDLTAEDFYRKLVQSKTLPTTATPAPGTFAEVFDGLAEETDEILAIVISSNYSATYQAAVDGKELRKSKARLEIIDSLWATMGLGLIAISATKAAQAGASFNEVIDVAQNSMRRVDMRMAFDTLEYLKRGGRIGTAQAFLGSMLKVNPVLTIKDGYTEAVASGVLDLGGIKHTNAQRHHGKLANRDLSSCVVFRNLTEMIAIDSKTYGYGEFPGRVQQGGNK